MKRQTFSWVPGGCSDHNDCDCDLYVEFPALGLPPILEPRIVVHKRTVREMFAASKAYIATRYYLKPNGQVASRDFDWALYTKILRDFNTPSCSTPVTPPFPVSNTACETSIVPCERWEPLVRAVERTYWNKLGIMERADDRDKDQIPTLRSMLIKKLSWRDAVFGDTCGFKRVLYTTSYFPFEKQMRLYADFNVETMRRGPSEAALWEYTPGALGWLNFQMDVAKNHGCVNFKVDLRKLARRVKVNTSGGVAPGGTFKGELRGETVRVISSGRKLYLITAALRKLFDILVGIDKEDNTVLNAIFCVIKLKHELKISQFGTIRQLRDLLMKMREFFIPDLTHMYMSVMVNEARMLLERNHIICIGLKWWYGGAYRVYKYLNGDLPDMIYVDGDIKGLDKHIQDWMLLLYCHGVYPYFRWEEMNRREKRFLRKLLIFWATNVAYKLVCHVGSFWQYMCGVMYSGGKETSHGDSWVMAFIFFCYCEFMKHRHPTRA